MRFIAVLAGLFHNLGKAEPLADPLVDLPDGSGELTAAGKLIHHGNALVGVFLQHHIPRHAGGIVAAGKILADGQADHIVGLQISLGIFLGAGAGAGGSTVVVVHGGHHFGNIQHGGVGEFAASHANFKGYNSKRNPRSRVFKGADLTAGIGNDQPRSHTQLPRFYKYRGRKSDPVIKAAKGFHLVLKTMLQSL